MNRFELIGRLGQDVQITGTGKTVQGSIAVEPFKGAKDAVFISFRIKIRSEKHRDAMLKLLKKGALIFLEGRLIPEQNSLSAFADNFKVLAYPNANKKKSSNDSKEDKRDAQNETSQPQGEFDVPEECLYFQGTFDDMDENPFI